MSQFDKATINIKVISGTKINFFENKYTDTFLKQQLDRAGKLEVKIQLSSDDQDFDPTSIPEKVQYIVNNRPIFTGIISDIEFLAPSSLKLTYSDRLFFAGRKFNSSIIYLRSLPEAMEKVLKEIHLSPKFIGNFDLKEKKFNQFAETSVFNFLKDTSNKHGFNYYTSGNGEMLNCLRIGEMTELVNIDESTHVNLISFKYHSIPQVESITKTYMGHDNLDKIREENLSFRGEVHQGQFKKSSLFAMTESWDSTHIRPTIISKSRSHFETIEKELLNSENKKQINRESLVFSSVQFLAELGNFVHIKKSLHPKLLNGNYLVSGLNLETKGPATHFTYLGVRP